jgi:SulP family sulfate permease
MLAGLTGAIVVLPQGVAFATIAGMPPQYGLYASIVPTIVAGLFGSSWQLVAGPSTTASLVLATSLSAFAVAGSENYVQFAMTLAVMAGAIELALGLFRLGGIVNFISHSVVVGYTAGVGALIIATQLKNLLGLQASGSHEFVLAILEAFVALPSASAVSASVAMSTLIAGIAARRFLPRIPYMLPAIAAGVVAAAWINYYHPGAAPTVGPLPASLPPLSMPSFDPHVWRLLIPTALAVAISSLNEVVSISKAIAIRTEQHVDVNREFVGQGLANIIGAFFSGYVVSGSFNRSALNYESGARTPLSAICSGIFLLALVFVAAPAAAYLPTSAMAASLVLIGWGLIDQKSIRHIWKSSSSERAILVVTLGTALFIHIQVAILIGVALSLLVYLYRTSRPRLRPRVPDPLTDKRKFSDVRADLPECPQARILRLDGSLYFGAVSSFRSSMRHIERETPNAKHIAIIMTGVNFIDLAGAEALAMEARRLRSRGGGLYLIRVKEPVIEYLRKGGYLADFDNERVFWSKTNALLQMFRSFDTSICGNCDRNVFLECEQLKVNALKQK